MAPKFGDNTSACSKRSLRSAPERPGARHGGGGPVVKDRCVRIAYCLYGQARRLDEGASNILGSLERMQPGCNTVRFYVHVWLPAKLGRDGTSQYGDAFSFFYNRPVRHKAPQNVTEQIRRLYHPVAMQAEPARSFELAAYRASLLYASERRHGNAPDVKLQAALSQSYSRWRVAELLRVDTAHLADTQLVMWSRFDFLCPLTLVAAELNPSLLHVADFLRWKSTPNRAALVPTCGTRRLPDNFFVAGKRLFFSVAAVYPNLLTGHALLNNRLAIARMWRLGEKPQVSSEQLLMMQLLVERNLSSYAELEAIVRFEPGIPNFLEWSPAEKLRVCWNASLALTVPRPPSPCQRASSLPSAASTTRL